MLPGRQRAGSPPDSGGTAALQSPRAKMEHDSPEELFDNAHAVAHLTEFRQLPT